MAARFASWERRYPGAWPGEIPGLAWRHALALEADVCALAGVPAAAVRRLAWTGSAIQAARVQASQRTGSVGSLDRIATARQRRGSAA
jgi:hypothetical protein